MTQPEGDMREGWVKPFGATQHSLTSPVAVGTGLVDFQHPALQLTSREGMRRVGTLPQPAELEDPAVAKHALGRELP